MFHFFIQTVHLTAGQPQADLAGLTAASASRRAARTRSADQLVLWVTLERQHDFSPNQLRDWLYQLSATFFNTAGSVTLAMRQAAMQLNGWLFERNMRAAREEDQLAAVLSMAVLHGGQLYLAHAGSTQAWTLSARDVDWFGDPQAGRGLGLSKTPVLRFYQPAVQAGDHLLLSHRPPASWTPDALSHAIQQGPPALHALLLAPAGSEAQAALIHLRPGKGEVQVVPLGSAAGAVTATPIEPATRLSGPAAPAVQQQPPAAEASVASIHKVGSEAPVEQPARRFRFPSTRPETAPPSKVEPADKLVDEAQGIYLTGERLVQAAEQEQVPAEALPARDRPPSRAAEPLIQPVEEEALAEPTGVGKKSVEAAARQRWSGGQRLKARTAAWSQSFLRRVAAPAESKPAAARRVSVGTLLFVAVAVPLVISAAAVTVYLRNGYGEQHQVFLAQAQTFASQAGGQSDPLLARQNWNQAVEWLDKAEGYGRSPASQQLRSQVQAELDVLDGVQRIELLPALTKQFDTNILIKSMVMAANQDIYILDDSQGRILRMIYTGGGYEIDPRFVCGPGQNETRGLIVGKLVDIAPVRPNNDHNASVMGLDQAGNLLFCGPGTSPEATTLLQPDSGWLGIADMVVSENALYVLDTVVPGVWRYSGDGVDFFSAPRLFFDSYVPPLEDVISMAVFQDFLFLLHQDGHLTKCTFSGFESAPTRCDEPMPYHLQGDGQDAQPALTLDEPLLQAQATELPAYSLFLFGNETPTIYYFSLALNLQTRLRPALDTPFAMPDRPATAFLVTANRQVLVAFGNEIYIGALP